MTAPEDPLEPFREAVEGNKSDLAEAIGALAGARDAGTIGHWLIVWVEKLPEGGNNHHTHFEDEVVGLGLAEYAKQSIQRSWEEIVDDDEEEA